MKQKKNHHVNSIVTTFETLIQTSCHFEQLIKVRSAVQNSFEGVIITQLKNIKNDKENKIKTSYN